MKKYIILFSMAVLIVTVIYLMPQQEGPLVMAASSLTNALEEANSIYQDENSIPFEVNLAATGILAHQIENGANPDIFIAASQIHVDQLVEDGHLTSDQVQPYLENSLVLVSLTDNQPLESLADLNNRPGIIAIAEPTTVPAGMYAKESLENSNIYEALSSRLVYGKNVRQTASYVRLEEADYGLVYKTDLAVLEGAHVLLEVDSSLHSPIKYPIVDVLQSKRSKTLIEFMNRSDIKNVFIDEGFKVINFE